MNNLTKNKKKKYENYEKNRDAMYEILASMQPKAIKNAKNLLEQYNPSYPAIEGVFLMLVIIIFPSS
ncbi:MAG: hypothetical protein QNJ74_00235 [Trichodesmium sp. MO_231.B1]|nr:hypothetical protein [Trichodesmium sp. MO_231.B1]